MMVYMLAKNFQCSPLEIEKLPTSDFYDYLKIIDCENVVQQKGNV